MHPKKCRRSARVKRRQTVDTYCEVDDSEESDERDESASDTHNISSSPSSSKTASATADKDAGPSKKPRRVSAERDALFSIVHNAIATFCAANGLSEGTAEGAIDHESEEGVVSVTFKATGMQRASTEFCVKLAVLVKELAVTEAKDSAVVEVAKSGFATFCKLNGMKDFNERVESRTKFKHAVLVVRVEIGGKEFLQGLVVEQGVRYSKLRT